ncbi:MAG: hypothetical protein HZB54_08095, partial [Deltaproteobacteria bacterium]|nr:hypothetical protein [Deltaproteobacteria bacterium]
MKKNILIFILLAVLAAAIALGVPTFSHAVPVYNPATDNLYDTVPGGLQTWTPAQAGAVNMGANLVTINDAAEQAWLLANGWNPNASIPRYWIGLNDIASEGTFVWVSGEPVTYTNWLPGEPNNRGPYGAENAVEMVSGGKWNDVSTLYLAPGIAEWAATLYVGRYAGSNETYSLSGGSRYYLYEYIGYDGTGTFTQSGGTNTVANTLSLGTFSDGSGAYNLSGGSLSASYEYIGFFGTGTFNQTGGTNTVANELTLGAFAGSTGTYNLSGGALNVGGNIVNGDGESTINIDGGTLNVTGSIDVDNFNVGYSSGSTGAYTLSNGSLSAVDEYIGIEGTGTFNQTGGTNTVANELVLGNNS